MEALTDTLPMLCMGFNALTRSSYVLNRSAEIVYKLGGGGETSTKKHIYLIEMDVQLVICRFTLNFNYSLTIDCTRF